MKKRFVNIEGVMVYVSDGKLNYVTPLGMSGEEFVNWALRYKKEVLRYFGLTEVK